MLQIAQNLIMMGYTAKQVLDYISKKVSGLSSGISNSRSQGYGDDDILKFLSGKVKPRNSKGVEQQLNSDEKYLKNIGFKTKEEKEQTRNKFISGALGVGAAALGGYGLYKQFKAPGAIKPDEIIQTNPQQQPLGLPFQGQRGLPAPKIPGGGAPIQPQAPQGTPPQAQPYSQPYTKNWQPAGTYNPTPLETLQPSTVTTQQQAPIAPPVKKVAKTLFDKLGISELVSKVQSDDPSVIAKTLDKYFLSSSQKKLIAAQTDQPLESLVSEFLQEPRDNSDLDVPPDISQSEVIQRQAEQSKQPSIDEDVPSVKQVQDVKPKYQDLEIPIDHLPMIEGAIKRTAKFISEGKSFKDLLPAPKGLQLSTADDVLRSLMGVPSKYNLLDDEEKEKTFNTFQGLTPNIIWNTISLLEPTIQKMKKPISPKGTKEGKKEMTPNDFRRFIAHAVYKQLSSPDTEVTIKVVDTVEEFNKKADKNHPKPEMDLQNLTDSELNALFDSVDPLEIKKYR